MNMEPVLWTAALVGWLVIGLWGAALLARGNQARGERRLPALERQIGLVYVAGALLGPASPAAAVLALRWFRHIDARDERAAERAKARRRERRRVEREAERSGEEEGS